MEFRNIAKYTAALVLTSLAIAGGSLLYKIRKEDAVVSIVGRYTQKAKEAEDARVSLSNEVNRINISNTNVVRAELAKKVKALEEKNEARFNVLSNDLFSASAEPINSYSNRLNQATNDLALKEKEMGKKIADLEDRLNKKFTYLTSQTNQTSLTPLERELYISANLPGVLKEEWLSSKNVFYNSTFTNDIKVTAKTLDDIEVSTKMTGDRVKTFTNGSGYILILEKNTIDNGIVSIDVYSTSISPKISERMNVASPFRTINFPSGNIVNVMNHSNRELVSTSGNEVMLKSDSESLGNFYSNYSNNRLNDLKSLLNMSIQAGIIGDTNYVFEGNSKNQINSLSRLPPTSRYTPEERARLKAEAKAEQDKLR